MQAATELQQDLVLVGGGHSHVLALRMLAMRPIADLRVTLVSPAAHTPYSGMLPGLISGYYTFSQAHIDLARLCQWAGARFITAEVAGLDARRKWLSIKGRPDIAYDVVSIDIGSQPEVDSVPGAGKYASPVKPIASFWQRWQLLLQQFERGEVGKDYRIALVGGGAGSVELALAMAERLQGTGAKLSLCCAAPEILPGYSRRARRVVMAALQQSGIELHLSARVVAVQPCVLQCGEGREVPFNTLFWCTGAAAAPWIAASGLATDEHGFLQVRDTLQAMDNESVFGAGDIAVQLNYPRPKAGVYAVRMGPVLAHNLRARLLNQPLQPFRPQRHFLSLLSLGGRRATAHRGLFSVTGAWVWRWKDSIDRAFVARFEALPTLMAATPTESLVDLPRQPHCGGCGAKIGADVLGATLARLHQAYPRHCVDERDDAAVLPAPAGIAIVQSIDSLRQLIADPWVMGRIAANHALSDLYACGVSPVSSLASVMLPYANAVMQERDLYQLLAGALYEFSRVDCQLRGGHSMQGHELGLGFVVNGVPLSVEQGLLQKTGSVPGDQLILTKPVGSGVLFAAHMQLGADGRELECAVNTLLQSNRDASKIALAFGATACTDITGFGLAGHLLEMLDGSIGARLWLDHLPLMPGALRLFQAGFHSTMHASNRRSAGNALQLFVRETDARLAALFDPQTSGGLLIAAPAGRASDLLTALHQAGYLDARIIGEVLPSPSAEMGSVLID